MISKRCEMVDFYPTHEEVENYAYDIDYEILSEYSHTLTVGLYVIRICWRIVKFYCYVNSSGIIKMFSDLTL